LDREALGGWFALEASARGNHDIGASIDASKGDLSQISA